MLKKEIYKLAHLKKYSLEELFELAQYIGIQTKNPMKIKGSLLFQEAKSSRQPRLNIIYPIYNEEVNIPTLLRSLKSAIGPAQNVNFIFALNGCTDNSEEILLSELNAIKKEAIKEQCFDGYSLIHKINLGSTSVSVINVTKRGKVFAMKQAIEYINPSPIEYVLTLDADFIIEPYSLVSFSQAILKYSKPLKKPPIIVGTPIMISKSNMRSSLVSKYHYAWDFSTYKSIPGCCVAYNASWLMNNLEEYIIEDYALGLKAREQGLKIVEPENTRFWGFKNNLSDEFRQLRRSIVGRLQILNLDPHYKAQVTNDVFFMRSPLERVKTLYSKAESKPRKLLTYFSQFIFIEACIISAKISYLSNPKLTDWNRLKSSDL